MKKTNIAGRLALAAVALALTLGACQKEENTSDTPGGELKTLRIEVEKQGAGGSKMETEGLQVYWNAGDMVGIKNRTYPVTISDGNAGVQNVPVDTVSYRWVMSIGQLSTGQFNYLALNLFNAYYPASIVNYDDEYQTLWESPQPDYYSRSVKVSLPSRYESGFVGGRQQIQLPMIGTYCYNPDNRFNFPNPDPWLSSINIEIRAPVGREVLRFQHLTAALLVKVRNDSGQPLLVDRVAVSSGFSKLCGDMVVAFSLNNPFAEVGLTQENIARAREIYPRLYLNGEFTDNDAQKQVEVVFPEPVVVAPGAILPVQVPILPMAGTSILGTDNLTVRVEGRNESAPGTIGRRRLMFEHTVEMAEGIARNEMKTIQIKMDPASPRVTSTAPAFSIDAGNKVLFSQGNLQYDKATSTWSFMEHQWSTVETHGQDVGADYAAQDIVSLFGWGTSGHGYGPDNYQPWSTSTTGTYGPGSSVLSPTGQSDWGCNAIANGGNTANSGWFTLSRAQWAYLLGDTPERNGRWTLATVNNVPGLLLLPDDQPPFTSPDLTQYTTYTYTLDTWQDMEALGAVFLPAAGMRSVTSVTRIPESAPSTYWTSDPVSDGQSAYALFMVPGAVFPNADVRERGSAVRLVRYAQ
ncbi:MAG: hypothetical protein SPL12_08450 [Bacteroidales bacterium]|nr:hypothetical protein [Bacteroidales bacterium]